MSHSAIASGMSWEDIEDMVDAESKKGKQPNCRNHFFIGPS